MKYSVLILDRVGPPQWVAVEGDSVKEAQERATLAAFGYAWATDFEILLVIEGHHKDIKEIDA